jgi:hypothetical protein
MNIKFIVIDDERLNLNCNIVWNNWPLCWRMLCMIHAEYFSLLMICIFSKDCCSYICYKISSDTSSVLWVQFTTWVFMWLAAIVDWYMVILLYLLCKFSNTTQCCIGTVLFLALNKPQVSCLLSYMHIFIFNFEPIDYNFLNCIPFLI